MPALNLGIADGLMFLQKWASHVNRLSNIPDEAISGESAWT
jgi:hypothetical protein